MLQSSIISSNLPGDNNTGPITDSGHNISSDRSCGFTNVGSMNTTDPKLRALAYNGGATPTMALLPSSPAIDAADNSACPRIDQRGVLRPQITACDIGAYELCPDYFYIRSFTPTGPGQFTIWGVGIPLLPFTLLASADLVTWEKVAQGTVTTNGLVEIVTDSTLRFFRIRAP